MTSPVEAAVAIAPHRRPRTACLPAMVLTCYCLFFVLPVCPVTSAFGPSSSTAQSRRLLVHSSSPLSSTQIFGAFGRKGSKFHKQNDLAAKMADAKRQREREEQGLEPDAGPAGAAHALTNKEIKERNDKKRFADLLDASLTGGANDNEYLTLNQENEAADAAYSRVDRIYEMDPAPTAAFPGLVQFYNSKPLGEGGMKRILPWISSKPSSEFLVVITDPRPKSTELRVAMKQMAADFPKDLLEKVAVVNADTPAENRRFVKKNLPAETCRGSGANFDTGMGGSTTGMAVLCDEKLEWMREYTALGQKRFSMTMFVLADGYVQKVAREVKGTSICDVVENAIKSL